MKLSNSERRKANWTAGACAVSFVLAGCSFGDKSTGSFAASVAPSAPLSKPSKSPAAKIDSSVSLTVNELATPTLNLQCSSPDKIYAQIDTYLQDHLGSFLDSNKCDIDGVNDSALNKEKTVATSNRSWRLVFGISGVPFSRNDVLSNNQSVYQRSVRSQFLESWADQVEFSIQLRFPKRVHSSRAICESRYDATYAKDFIVDAVRLDMRQAADLSCGLAVAGVTETTLDSPSLCTLRVSDDLVSKLLTTEFERCKIEDAKACGFDSAERLAEVKLTSSVCLAASEISSSQETSWSLLDGIEVGSSEQGFSGMVNLFSLRWGGAPASGLSRRCVSPQASPKFRIAASYLESKLNALKERSGCSPETLTTRFTKN